ncbi:NADH dehydrogenase [Allosphingosinicella indica]|uniref:NADH dehydrogenase n=2 Tax=Allosphingosinicella indica TaxID=941907 RepID=A0A1X7GHB9_9SPHN|nr:NADH dehydrogenase [Allosphingosinicella indica]
MVQKIDRLVTLFGGGGFLGRYAAQALYRSGARVRIAQTNPRQAFFLKPLGGLGQTQFVRADIRDADQVRAAVRGSDAVVNLVGVLKGDFYGLHVDGAENVARAAADEGAAALVHVSAIGADPDSASRYGKTKGKGEALARAAFPGATILRPSILFGREDDFINRFARMAQIAPAMPVIRGDVKFQPVSVSDVGRAVAAAALDPGQFGGKIYELGGPEVLTMRQLVAWILRATARPERIIDIPDPVAAAMARFGGWAPGAPITWDQWLMLAKDNVPAAGSAGLDAFGIAPTPLEAVAESWLTTYRRSGRFAIKSPA